MIKYKMDTETGVDYRDNESEMEINYGDENKMDYGNFEDINLEITRNNILLLLLQPLL